jgi:hypothetical protein
MLVISIIALISTAGIAFYARFLVALCSQIAAAYLLLPCATRLW